MRRAILVAGCLLALCTAAIAEGPPRDALVDRLMSYTLSYPDRFATVVAEEDYQQYVESVRSTSSGTASDRTGQRTIKSDYALTRVSGEWVAYRDTYEADGLKIRDRNGRLERVVSNAGTPDELSAILNDNARFNIKNDQVSRNINLPTLVIQVLHPRNRARFSFAKDGEETIGGQRLSRLTFRERTMPTLVRRANDQDQPVRGTVWLDDVNGEVWRTNLTWEKGPGGNILVDYGHVPDIGPLVPLRMSERYKDGSTEIRAEARYSRFRQFRTSGRLLAP